MGYCSHCRRGYRLTATTSDRVKSIASDVFAVPAEAISCESSPETIDGWDSPKHLSFVLALEETFQFQLSPEETERIRTIGDAVKLMEDKLQIRGQ
jgi:acyl carrier protein